MLFLLNVLIKNVTNGKDACVNVNEPLTIEILKVLANKKVDQAKIDGYIQELVELGLVSVEEDQVYIEEL